MGNQDKIFNQIKTAAENAETKDFPSMENVWSRVEGKLDKKVLKKENTLWKKIAVAASLLFIVSIGYHYFTSGEKIIIPKKDVVTIDTTKSVTPQKHQEQVAVVAAPTRAATPSGEVNTNPITAQQPVAPNQIVINNNYTITDDKGKSTIITDSIIFTSQNKNGISLKSNTTFYNPVFNSRGVVYKDEEIAPISDKKEKHEMDAKKLDPLVVIDDKASSMKLADVEAGQMESIEILPDPLYIINGSYYTEKELFGPKPTSPYAPLSKLKIETITILQKEKATAIYGEKGKKGVVIITTKTGNPEFK